MIWSKNNLPVFIYEDEAFSGVKKIADYVRRDMSHVFGRMPEKAEFSRVKCGPDVAAEFTACVKSRFNTSLLFFENKPEIDPDCIIFGTLGKSSLLDELASKGVINVENLRDMRETFLFEVKGNILVIAGSDKRGTIYGLFHLSKLLGVSPFTDWSDLRPKRVEKYELTDTVKFLSKEPSVKYRGFFINDEWPAFGTYAKKHFGGINAKLYEVIFTMLLRMNGNYLWPAMWDSCFSLDGPGLESAYLADELGVIMGLSHHEPCFRHGEEYSKVRGKDSIYGDAWDFKTNREGITRFFRDGLKRNGKFENIVTIGMRGERDSKILSEDATLEDNIELIKDVINTQNELIKQELNQDLTTVPCMLALYKEVEPFFFGDETTKGLIGDKCLDDVILLLCDDNHGYLRSRPNAEMLKTNNTYGLYYHFDYHGEPISYEWVNSTYLPEVWEELTEAYETGIRELFIVNVGDIAFNEFALNYFLDFAYDYEKWGINAPNSTDKYTREWFEFNFGGVFERGEDAAGLHNTNGLKDDCDLHKSDCDNDVYDDLTDIWTRACRLNHARRPEHLNENTYPAKDFSSSLNVLSEAKYIFNKIDEFEKACTGNKDAFIALISYQVKASMNLISMWIYKSFNAFCAKYGMTVTNTVSNFLEKSQELDVVLTETVHTINNRRYDGLALASHIGFKHWNNDECAYPPVEKIRLFERSSIIAGVDGSDEVTSGYFYTKKTLVINDFRKLRFYVALTGSIDSEYKVVCDNKNITFSKNEGILTVDNPYEIIEIGVGGTDGIGVREVSGIGLREVDRDISLHNFAPLNPPPVVHVLSGESDIEIKIDLSNGGAYTIDCTEYVDKYEIASSYFITLKDIGNTSNGIKLFKKCDSYSNGNEHTDNESHLIYKYPAPGDGIYRLTFTFLPCNPRDIASGLRFGYKVNNSAMRSLNSIKPGHMPGVSGDWADGVITHERSVSCLIELKAGDNEIAYYPTQLENVLLTLTFNKIMSI